MGGDGEELGGLSDGDDDGSLEDEMSNLRVKEDLDIEELMRDGGDSQAPEPRTDRYDDRYDDDASGGGPSEERIAAMPRRERSAVLAAAVYGAFNSDDYRKNPGRNHLFAAGELSRVTPGRVHRFGDGRGDAAAQGDEARPPRRS